jgi:DNA primase
MTVEQFIAKYGTKTRPNRSGWLICCPYPEHEDHTPSFSVNEEGLFYCWGCHRKGNFARLLHDIAGWSWNAAIAHSDVMALTSVKAVHTHQSAGQDTHLFLSRGLLGLYDVDWEQGYEQYQFALQRYVESTDMPAWCFPFMKGFTPATLRVFQAGFDMDSNRITIPVFDAEKRLLGFLGRTCTGDPMKYRVYPPLSPSKTVYGLPYRVIGDACVLVEGAWDVWTLYQWGIPNVLAVMTSRISEEQVQVLARACRRYVLLFDGDRPGREGARQVASALLTAGCTIDVAMNYQKGVTDLKRVGSDEVRRMLMGAKPWPAPSCMELLQGDTE